MGSISVEIDATGSAIGGGNPDGTAYALSSANGYSLLSFDAPEPSQDIQWASSADTEGESLANQRYTNRIVTARFRLAKASDAALESELNSLGKKIGKLVREGGTLKVTVPSGTVCYLDVLNAQHVFAFDHRFLRIQRGEVTLTLPCKPFIRGAEVELGSDTTETSAAYLTKTVTGPAGDVPALGRLLIDNDQATDQWWLIWGLESQNYSNSANAALFYEAEGRTAMGGSATAAGPSGASGGGSNVMRNTSLPTEYLAILSTQATGGGAHLSHVGLFHAYMRVQIPTSNTGFVTVALEWGEGDFLRWTRNAETTLDSSAEGKWVLVDLGLVALTKVVSGTQRWEGRIVAKSTVFGDDIDIDYLLLVPAAEGSGIVTGVEREYTPTSYVARDEFTGTTAGNALNARSAPAGGSWATSGSATDLVFADNDPALIDSEHITRSATGTRYAVLGTTDYTNVRVEGTCALASTASANKAAIGARWTDSSNHLVGRVTVNTNLFEIVAVVGGSESVLASTTNTVAGAAATRIELALTARASGKVTLTATVAGELEPRVSLSATSSVLATGGTLATGEPFIADTGAAAVARYYDDFRVSVPPSDAAVFASQSIEIRHDRIVREDSGGTLWVKPSSYVGDYLLIPPTGQEGRSARVIVKVARLDPFTEDPAIDDISARWFATPRFLAIPD